MRSSSASRGRPSRSSTARAHRASRAVLALAAVGLWLAPSRAHAYCRTTTCDPQTENCDPPAGSDCTTAGLPVYWPGLCVGYSLQRNASQQVPFDTFQKVADTSFSTWTQVDCGGGKPPTIELSDMGPVTCDQPEYNQHSGNANIVMFRDTSWPYSNATNTLALTTVTFNTKTGEIYDVDMEINSWQTQLTTSDTGVHYDLQSIITHEAGHFLGLAHSSDPAATMYASYEPGTTTLRSLSPDDEAGICAVYPPDRSASTCDVTPRHGYQDTCGDTPPKPNSGCAVHAPDTEAPGSAGLIAGIVSLVAFAAARRRRQGA